MWLMWIIIIALAGVNLGWICVQILWQYPEKKHIFSYPHCKICNNPITFIQSIPILGYILLKGRCSHCKGTIPSFVLILPLVSPIILILLFLKFDLSLLFFQYGLLSIVGMLIFFLDLYYRAIPDIITLPMMACGIAFSLVNDLGFWFAIKGFALGAGVFILIALIFRLITKRDGLGGGDIKLIAMIGLFLGLRLTFLTIFLSSIFGMLIYAFSRKRSKALIPYGSFIVMAMFVSILVGNELITWYLRMWGI